MLGDIPPMFDAETLEVVSVDAFLSWAFRHPRANVGTFPVHTYSRLLRRHVQVGSFRALCKDGKPILLADGSEPGWSGAYFMMENRYFKRDGHHPPTGFDPADTLFRFAVALDIPFIPY